MGLQVSANGPQNASKSLTFTGAAGLGAIGNVPLFTVTGTVLVEKITATCLTTLVGASATIALGVTGSTSLFIAATVGTTIATTAPVWTSTTPVAGGQAVPAAMKDVHVAANIVGTVAIAAITAGAVRFDVQWRPLSADGNVQ